MKSSHIFAVDIIAAVIYIVAANPLITGLAIHEWASIGVLVVFIVHSTQHYDWLIDIFKKLRSHPNPAQVGHLVLDIVSVIVFMIVTVSGIMVSRIILPLFGLVAPGYFFWNPLHSLSAKVLLALLIVHVVAHAGRLWAFIKARGKEQKNSILDDGTEPDV